jgi:isocitrate dehydrogenase kinase/phosphatase
MTVPAVKHTPSKESKTQHFDCFSYEKQHDSLGRILNFEQYKFNILNSDKKYQSKESHRLKEKQPNGTKKDANQ